MARIVREQDERAQQANELYRRNLAFPGAGKGRRRRRQQQPTRKTDSASLVFFFVVGQVHCRLWQHPGFKGGRLVLSAEGAHIEKMESEIPKKRYRVTAADVKAVNYRYFLR